MPQSPARFHVSCINPGTAPQAAAYQPPLRPVYSHLRF